MQKGFYCLSGLTIYSGPFNSFEAAEEALKEIAKNPYKSPEHLQIFLAHFNGEQMSPYIKDRIIPTVGDYAW